MTSVASSGPASSGPAGFPLFLILWNRRQNLMTPAHQLRIANWLHDQWQRGERQLLLLAFRNSGKSTLVGLFCAWLLHQNPDLRILVVSAEQLLAEKMLRQTRTIIESHPLTGGLKPRGATQWSALQFTVTRQAVMRDPSMLARGLGANITGARADVIICDDVEVPTTCHNPQQRAALRQALGELDFILTPGGAQLYIGTPHSYDTIYAVEPCRGAGDSVPFLQGYQRLAIPLLDKAGRSAWPERFDAAAIAQLRRSSGPLKFNSQMQLEAVNSRAARLDPALLKKYDAELRYEEAQGSAQLWLGTTQLVAASCWWDPAFSGARDGSVVALVFVDGEGVYYLHRIAYLKTDRHSADDEATQQCEAVASLLDSYFVPVITIETNGIGKFLPARLRQVLAARKIPCAVREAHASQNKAQRILAALDAPLAAQAVYAHKSLWQTSFITEMRDWQPAKANSADDGLDAVAGAISATPMRLKGMAQAAVRVRWGSVAGWRGKTEFEV